MKFEFGDLYKFVVSLGVVLISLSVIAPWLFLKEPFDLFKTTTELNAVTEVAREAIITRQKSVAFILRFIPWFSGIGILCGVVLIYIGLKRWYVNQLLLDEQAKIEVEIKKQSLRDATKDEVSQSAARDFEAVESQEQKNSENRFSAFEVIYDQIEQKVANRFQDVYASKYVLERNKMIGGIEIDLLLRGKSMLAKDVIIEIKYIRRGFNFGWLREAFLKNIYAKNIYAQLTNRLPNTILLIITDFHGEQPTKYGPMLERVAQENLGRKGKDNVVMITNEELQNHSQEDLQQHLGLYA